ncbi:MAG: type II secretion system protein [Candidatus Gastranaerophilales bacterium]
MLKPSWIIRVLVGVTSHSNKRVRFSHPTENPQVQGDKKPLLNRIQGGSRIPLQRNASEQRQKANPSVRAGLIPLLWRGDREVGVVSMKKRSAFTLAEVLITLGIIGVVAAMTMPNLISNMQSEALAKKKLLFDGRLEDAIKYCDGSTSFSNDYWAGAMKACGEQSKSLPTMQQLADMNNYIFDTDKISAYSAGVNGLTLNTDKLAEFNIGNSFYGNATTGIADYYRFWSDDADADGLRAYYRHFNSTSSSYNASSENSRAVSQVVARCVK